MLKRIGGLAVLAMVSAAAACSTPSKESVETSGAAVETLPNDTAWAQGTNWKYEHNFAGLPHAWVYTPSSYSQKAPTMRGAIIHLIGCGELPYQVAQGTGWPAVAEKYGLVVIVPEIIDPSYPNAAAPNTACYDFGSTAITQPSKYTTDHAALIAAGQKLAKGSGALGALKIDPRQIYIAGMSAGATVAMQVACMAPEVFTGVGSVVGPSLGTWQAATVMPPVWDADQIRWGCNYYVQDNDDPDKAAAEIKNQVYAIVSDNNGLPAGIPEMIGGVWTATEFADQDYWDGDKYVPYAHHQLVADAMAPLLGAKQTGKDVPIDGLTGSGVGCPGGEKSHDDTAEVACNFTQYTPRNWQVKADVWTDAQGRQRIVHLKQDTLRHRWPVGPLGPLDHEVTPTFATLVQEGYMDEHAQVNVDKVGGAPSGTFGVGFFGNDTFNFTEYLADFLTKNNPRL